MSHVSRGRSRGVIAAAATAAVLLLAGCGSGDASGTTTVKGGVTLVKPGQLTVCTHLPDPPFQSERDGEVVGFDVDLIDLVAADLGVKQVIVDGPFETIKTGAALNARQCDIAAVGMTITEERKKNLDFSAPYFDADQAVLARAGTEISTADDLKGHKLGSMSSTTGEDYLRGKGLDPQSFVSVDAQLNALRTGQVDAIVQDSPVVTEWLKDPSNAKFRIALSVRTGEQYGFAVRKGGDGALLKAVNTALADAKADGTYKKLYATWFGAAPGGSAS